MSIDKKLFAILKEIDAVAPEGYNANQKYYYTRAVDITRAARKALIKHNVSFSTDVTDVEHWVVEGKSNYVLVEMAFTFTDLETSEDKTIAGVGIGADSLDKAVYKAQTGALKHALKQNFLILDAADDPEAEEEEEAVQPAEKPATSAMLTQSRDTIPHEKIMEIVYTLKRRFPMGPPEHEKFLSYIGLKGDRLTYGQIKLADFEKAKEAASTWTPN